MPSLEEPDKGHAWVVAIAACIINMILSGLSRMIGMLYVAVIDSYKVSRQEATFPFTVRNSVRSLAGPLVGVVGQRFGIRKVTFWGGVMASLGAGLCSLAPNVLWLTVFWGGIHGLGFAFANTLFQVVINQYFQKYKATASGIALSGACVGSFAFPFIMEEILDKFGLSDGFLLICGIVMHVLPPALLLKSPPWIEDPEGYEKKRCALQNNKDMETKLDSNYKAPPSSYGNVKERIGIIRSTSFSNNPVEEVHVSSFTLLKRRSKGFIDQFSKFVSTDRQPKKGNEVICTQYVIKEFLPPMEEKETAIACEYTSQSNGNTSSIYAISHGLEDMQKKPTGTSSTGKKSFDSVSKSENPTMKENMKTIIELYANPMYILINICMASYVVVFIPILTVLVDYSKDKGIDETAGKYLINAMAAGDLAGRLCFGWVTDKSYMSVSNFMILMLTLQGISIVLFPFALTLYTYMLLLAFYGLTAGSMLVQFPILVNKYVDDSVQPIAIGCYGFLSGLVSFSLPVLIGHFRDHAGSYDGMFYVTGSISVICGVLWLFEPMMVKCHTKNQR